MTIEEAIEILKELWRYKETTKYTDAQIRKALDMAIAIIKASNPQEQKKGKWISSYIGTICSNCYYKLETTGLLSRCPNCDAQMEEW